MTEIKNFYILDARKQKIAEQPADGRTGAVPRQTGCKELSVMDDNKFIPEEQNIVSFSLMGPESGGPCLVDSNGGRITRIRPYLYDKE